MHMEEERRMRRLLKKSLSCRLQMLYSAADSKVKVLLIPTNEELMIAMDTMNIVK